MRNLITTVLFVCLAFTGTAQSDDRPVVVELFTSQGCSSCPPADAFLQELAQRSDVIPLGLHVDYWDYLGWPDKFASASFSARQRAYAKSAHKRTIYTPQVVVQGIDREVGHRADEILSLIERHGKRTDPVELALSRRDGAVDIRLLPLSGGVGKAVVQLVRYIPKAEISIKAGENAGRQIVYTNIVTDWRPLAIWDGKKEFRATVKLQGAAPVVVIVQSAGFGPIIAARTLR